MLGLPLNIEKDNLLHVSEGIAHPRLPANVKVPAIVKGLRATLGWR